jgi:outer membrane protein assembly factor BamB
MNSTRNALAIAASLMLGTVASTIVSGIRFTEPAHAQQTEVVAVAKVTAVASGKQTGDWAQWGGDSLRNNVPQATGIPTTWDIGGIDRESGEWQKDKSANVKWAARLGSQSYGNPVVAGGQIYVGTNNGAGHLARFPADKDLGCLLCFSEADGKFLWQHSSLKLKTGRVHDWPLQGICCAPLVEGKRLWFVTSRGEVLCLDTEGFRDGENDGPYKDEDNENKDEADVIWVFNMMKELGVSQHNMCSCSVTAYGDLLFVNTSNGVDNGHLELPNPGAPSFICLNKNTGEVHWTDNRPLDNVLHGQWSSPAIGELGGVAQVIFAGGDGWVYSFEAGKGTDGKGDLLWKFDGNPKESKWILGGRGTRNNIIATPVIHNDKVYVAMGQDPEHGEGVGHLWCIDPTKRGDVSAELAVSIKDRKPIKHRRLQAVIAEDGEMAVDNPNSAVVWHYSKVDRDGNKKISFEETMHRSCGTVAIKGNLLFISDFSGLFHCLDPETGKVNWVYDMLAAAWGSPLIVGGHVYIGDEDGDVSVFKLSADPAIAMDDEEPITEINMENSVYSTPIVANGTLYIANRTHLFAIEANDK